MKKILLCFAMFLGFLTACSDSGDDRSSSAPPSPAPEIKQTEPVISETAAPPAKDAASLIPAGWHMLKNHQSVMAEGDLNKDGIPDLAMIIERTEDSMEAPRSLLIAFGTKENTYTLSILAEHVILAESEGGTFGDPFNGLLIDRGSVVISDYGGSMTKWYHTYRFRFQDNDWVLIGATIGTNFPINNEMVMGNDEDDYNLLTGDFISKRTNKAGEEEMTKGNRGKKPLVKLSEFDVDEI